MNNFLDHVLGLISPHICARCGRAGAALCERCNFHILSKKFDKCVFCENKISAHDFAKFGNLCSNCAQNFLFSRVFCVGAREKSLKKLLDDFKFAPERGAFSAVSKLFSGVLPENLPRDLTVVPLTTVAKNVRVRGFDHMKIVAKKLAKIRRLRVSTKILQRKNNITQHFAKNFEERKINAENAFFVSIRAKKSNKIPEKILLIDDILTTGSSVNAAAKVLRENGAKEIWLAICARQPKISKKFAKKT